jgi:ABC-2 type transport system permease protein
MNKTYLIFKHKFLYTIKRIGFITMTLIVPLLALLGIGIGQLMSTMTKPPVIEIKTIGYIDEVGKFDHYTTQGNIKLVRFNTLDDATQALIRNDVAEYFVIPEDYTIAGVIHRYTLEKEVDTSPVTKGVIKNFLTSNLLAGKVPPDILSLIESPLYLEVTRLTKTGAVASEQSGIGNIIIPGVFSLLLGLSLMFSSSYLIQGLGEEKESRLIEVLLSSVSIRQLLTGKILALGAAGLVQVLVWLISAPALLNLASTSFGGSFGSFISKIQIPTNFLILGIIYFVLGYLLFAVLSVGVGAISPNAREGQQLSLIYTLFGPFTPLWFLSLLFIFPKSPIWVVLTIFPITAPVETMLRLGVTGIPAWELAASIAVLGLSIIWGLVLAIKVFRVYLLMYGKRPSFGKIIHNLRTG